MNDLNNNMNETGKYIIAFFPEENRFCVINANEKVWWKDSKSFSTEKDGIDYFYKNIKKYILLHFFMRFSCKEESLYLPSTVVLNNSMQYWDYSEVLSKFNYIKRKERRKNENNSTKCSSSK